jgi:hypothetical protein
VLVQLGREDRLDLDGLRRLVGSISRYLDGAGALPPGPEAPLQVQSSRQLGSVWLLEGLWQRLGVADALRGCWAGAGSPPRWSGCCSPWSVTARSTR